MCLPSLTGLAEQGPTRFPTESHPRLTCPAGGDNRPAHETILGNVERMAKTQIPVYARCDSCPEGDLLKQTKAFENFPIHMFECPHCGALYLLVRLTEGETAFAEHNDP